MHAESLAANAPRPVVELPVPANALNAPGCERANNVDFVQQSAQSTNALTDALREMAARLLASGTPTTAPQSTQLEFSFAAEIRAESLTVFRQRTAGAARNLDGARRDTLITTSKHVAARFELSMTVSATVLIEFAAGAQKLGDSTDLDQFLELTRKLLGELDETLNQFFEELSGLFTLGEDAQRFLDDIANAYAGNRAPQQTVRAAGVQLEFAFSVSITVEATLQESDPIVLDLDGDGIELTSYRDGALFDITATGRVAQTAFVTGGDAFLAIDRNGNGIIDDGAELFGDQRGAANGFEELRKLDSNRDNVIDHRDTAFDQLLLFRDNGNGITEPGELLALAQAGIASISLDYRETNQPAAGGNRIAQIATFTRNDGTTSTAADAILNYLA